MTETVDILLATYNGARFLPEQLASIEAQTHRGWRLLVRDDGSSDRTSAIVEEFAQRHRGRVRVLRDRRGRLGACGNFAALLEASDAPYFMFCDQDDVWLPEKTAALFSALRTLEERRGAATPILVHSDLIAVDARRRVLDRSYWRRARLIDPAARGHRLRIILRNYVTGCASIGNAALRRAALPIPAEAYMHDWWVAVAAAILGEIAEHEPATILYRQHQSNELGAQARHLSAVLFQFVCAPLAEIRRVRLYVWKSQKQIALFQATHQQEIDPGTRQLLSEFSVLREAGWWRRKSFLFRYDIRPDYWVPAIALLCFM